MFLTKEDKLATNEVYNQETITLQDGTQVVLKPLVISKLRKFMKEWKRMEELAEQESPDEDAATYIYIDCVGICLSKHFEESKDFDNLWATGAKATKG